MYLTKRFDIFQNFVILNHSFLHPFHFENFKQHQEQTQSCRHKTACRVFWHFFSGRLQRSQKVRTDN